jgi:hypothetical protein
MSAGAGIRKFSVDGAGTITDLGIVWSGLTGPVTIQADESGNLYSNSANVIKKRASHGFVSTLTTLAGSAPYALLGGSAYLYAGSPDGVYRVNLSTGGTNLVVGTYGTGLITDGTSLFISDWNSQCGAGQSSDGDAPLLQPFLYRQQQFHHQDNGDRNNDGYRVVLDRFAIGIVKWRLVE